jgi:hypothetical protein
MHIYSNATRFCPHTGRPLDPILLRDPRRVICDYSGQEFDTDDDTLTPYYNLSIEYNHDSEPSWYQSHDDFNEDFKVGYGDFSNFMSSPYHFMHSEAYGAVDYSWFLIEEWLTARRGKNKKHRFYRCGTIEQAMKTARLDTLRKLLESKKYKLEELGFSHNEDTYN